MDGRGQNAYWILAGKRYGKITLAILGVAASIILEMILNGREYKHNGIIRLRTEIIVGPYVHVNETSDRRGCRRNNKFLTRPLL
jgi:hypothetical protein